MVEYLIRKGLDMHVSLAVLSRGYGRTTKGVRIASPVDTAQDLGDESFGYYAQFGERIRVVVAERRVEGMTAIRAHFPDVRVVILDDAFQHRALKPDYSLLLTPFHLPFWKDYLLPAGRLREARSGFRRADALILTKCPHAQDVRESDGWKTLTEMEHLCAATSVRYGDIISMQGKTKSQVIAVAGLADNRPFFSFLEANYSVVACFSFPDHKRYQATDLEEVVQLAVAREAMIVTTFKDAVKLKDLPIFQTISWGYVPIETYFLAGEEEFLKNVTPFLNPSTESFDHP